MSDPAPHVSDVPLSHPPTTKPGGIAFPVGSGRGQWAVFAGVAMATVVSVVWGSRFGLIGLMVVCGVCAVLRLTLPPHMVPALVNRGRGFDVAANLVWAAAIGAVLLSGVSLL